MTWVPCRYSSFRARALAALIDGVWLASFCSVLGFALISGVTLILQPPPDVLGRLAGLSFAIPSLLLIAIWRLKQTSPGKAAISCRIVDAATGERPSLPQCALRYCGYALTVVTLGLGFLWILVDSRRQALHDKLARTVVVRDSDGFI